MRRLVKHGEQGKLAIRDNAATLDEESYWQALELSVGRCGGANEKITWKSTDDQGRGAITCTWQHCKLFSVEDFLEWVPTYLGKDERRTAPYDWRKPNRLLTLQIGDAANEQVVFPAYGAPDGECDNLSSAPKPVKKLMKSNKLVVAVKGLTEKAVRTELWRPCSRTFRWKMQERSSPWAS